MSFFFLFGNSSFALELCVRSSSKRRKQEVCYDSPTSSTAWLLLALLLLLIIGTIAEPVEIAKQSTRQLPDCRHQQIINRIPCRVSCNLCSVQCQERGKEGGVNNPLKIYFINLCFFFLLLLLLIPPTHFLGPNKFSRGVFIVS